MVVVGLGGLETDRGEPGVFTHTPDGWADEVRTSTATSPGMHGRGEQVPKEQALITAVASARRMAADWEQTSQKSGQSYASTDPRPGLPRLIRANLIRITVPPTPTSSSSGSGQSDPRQRRWALVLWICGAALTCTFRGALRGARPPQKGVRRRPHAGSGQGEDLPPTDSNAGECDRLRYRTPSCPERLLNRARFSLPEGGNLF